MVHPPSAGVGSSAPVSFGNTIETRPVKGIRKHHLPEKVCASCGRPFTWRKKWERVWNEVKYCSDHCRMNKIKKWDDGSNPSNAHNVIAEISTTTESSSVTTVNFNFTYNSYNFPVTSNFMFGSSLIGTSQYFYLQP